MDISVKSCTRRFDFDCGSLLQWWYYFCPLSFIDRVQVYRYVSERQKAERKPRLKIASTVEAETSFTRLLENLPRTTWQPEIIILRPWKPQLMYNCFKYFCDGVAYSGLRGRDYLSRERNTLGYTKLYFANVFTQLETNDETFCNLSVCSKTSLFYSRSAFIVLYYSLE